MMKLNNKYLLAICLMCVCIISAEAKHKGLAPWNNWRIFEAPNYKIGGETDCFVFTDYNTVVNAYFNKSLCVMSQMAVAVGEEQKSREYHKWHSNIKRHLTDYSSIRRSDTTPMESRQTTHHSMPICSL